MQLFFKGCNSAKKSSIKKTVIYAQGLDVLINPVKFHSNCSGSLGGVVQTNFKNKNH